MLSEQKTNTNLGIALGLVLMAVARLSPEGRFSQPLSLVIGGFGLLIYLWGCASYAAGKGHSGFWAIVAFIPVLGLMILVLLPDHNPEQPGRKTSAFAYFLFFILLSVGALVGWAAFREFHPATVEQAQKRALKLYPELGVLNSPINREFVSRYKKYKATNTAYFKDHKWPLALASESQAAVERASVRQ